MTKHLKATLFVLCLAAMLVLPRQAQGADLSGAWRGSWKSIPTGHKGPMRASFARVGSQHYRVTFRGRFWKIFPFRYSVTLRVVSENGNTTKLAGSSYLGRIMGTFHYSATVRGSHFYANYWSCKDHGYFQMTRCPCR